MKIVEAIKCYFSLFMSTFNLTFLYNITSCFKQNSNKREIFLYTLYILLYSTYTKYLY